MLLHKQRQLQSSTKRRRRERALSLPPSTQLLTSFSAVSVTVPDPVIFSFLSAAGTIDSFFLFCHALLILTQTNLAHQRWRKKASGQLPSTRARARLKMPEKCLKGRSLRRMKSKRRMGRKRVMSPRKVGRHLRRASVHASKDQC